MSSYGSWRSWGYDELDWDSEYDSTWEDDEDHKLLKQSNPKKKCRRFSLGSRAAQDLQRYRHGYPYSGGSRAAQDLQEPMLNLKFYRNEINFEPYGVRIDDLHNNWKFKYDELESNHSYIQWLFPLREPGMNRCAIPLTEKEIEEMKKDEDVMKRFLESYKLMLGFYGIELVDSKYGKVARAENWKERFSNLNTHSHNNLRITRILKCLGELGYEDYQAPLVEFFLEETLYYGNLQNVKTSALNYFMFTVKTKSKRKELVLFAWEHYKPKKRFTWGPMETLRKLRPPAPVENPENKTEDMEMEHKNISVPKNGRSKDDSEFQNKAREWEEESRDLISSTYANKEIKKPDMKKKRKYVNSPSERGSVGKESKPQHRKKSNVSKTSKDKANGKQPMKSGAANDKNNKGPPTESESVDDKEKKGAPMDSMSANGKEDKKPPTVLGSEDNQENGECSLGKESKSQQYKKSNVSKESKDKANGKQPMQSGAANDKNDKGPPTKTESVDGKGKKGAPMDSMSANGKEDRKTPMVSEFGNEKVNKESPVGSRSEGDKENEETPAESESKDSGIGGSQVESEDRRIGRLPMKSRVNDDKGKRSSPTEFESEDKANGKQLMQSGASNKDDKGSLTESESVDGNEKEEAPIGSMSDNEKENKTPPTDLGSEDNQENGAQSMQSEAEDDKSNTLPPI